MIYFTQFRLVVRVRILEGQGSVTSGRGQHGRLHFKEFQTFWARLCALANRAGRGSGDPGEIWGNPEGICGRSRPGRAYVRRPTGQAGDLGH